MMQRKQWTPEKIEAGIYEAMTLLNIDRMPTRSELYTALGDSSLYNKIAKTGGFAYWAEKLGLEIKSSDSKTGWKYEEMIRDLVMKNCDITCVLTTVKHPYDLYAGNGVKIDVKASKIYRNGSFIFRLEKVPPTCDFYALVCIYPDREDVYIVPSMFLEKTQVCFNPTDWHDLKNRYGLINRHSEHNHLYSFLEVPA